MVRHVHGVWAAAAAAAGLRGRESSWPSKPWEFAVLVYAIQNPFQAESKPFKMNLRAWYCQCIVKGWQCKSTTEFKRSELAILLQVLEHSSCRV